MLFRGKHDQVCSCPEMYCDQVPGPGLYQCSRGHVSQVLSIVNEHGANSYLTMQQLCHF